MPEFTDSISTLDSLQTEGTYEAKTDYFVIGRVCRADEAPSMESEKMMCTLGRVPYTEGIAPVERPLLPGYDSGVMCLLIGTFMLLTINYRHYTTFIKNFTHDLWDVRRKRDNLFGDRTVNEMSIIASLVTLMCVCEGIMLYSFMMYRGMTISDTFITIGIMTLLCGGYYLWQAAAYSTAGYIFADQASASLWIKGFNASQSLLGLSLIIPSLIVLFYPAATELMLIISLLLYVTARIIFISKGFRIFYTNFYSLVYFILYLCTLEIVPLILLYKASIFLSKF